jgi:predicted DNA binding CopG/RHH family protein
MGRAAGAEPKAARINMRLPKSLMRALKARAAERGIP